MSIAPMPFPSRIRGDQSPAPSRSRRRQGFGAAAWASALLCGAAWLLMTACGLEKEGETAPSTIRLVDVFQKEFVSNAPATPTNPPPRVEFTFSDANAAELGGWTAGRDIEGLAVRGGKLSGRSTGPQPLLVYEWDSEARPADFLRAIEIKATAMSNAIFVSFQKGETFDPESLGAHQVRVPLIPSIDVQAVTARVPMPVQGTDIDRIVLQTGDAPGSGFQIESLRLMFESEYLNEFQTGVSWEGLADIFHETLVARAPEIMTFRLNAPARPWLDLSVATVIDGPVTFEISASPAGSDDEDERIVRRRTVTSPGQWEQVKLDLGPLARQEIDLRLALIAPQEGAVGLWGSPVLRSRPARFAGGRSRETGENPPHGVILVLVDTLRRDHLDLYGHERPTAPNLARLAGEGATFDNAVAQGTWTKVSVPSIQTGLYPLTHTIHEFDARLPNSAQTLAETYRDAGYATVAFSSIMFTGRFSNLHQGYEELHEFTSLRDPLHSKTSREYVNRLLPWIEAHKDSPFFVFLHVFDPHDPFEPHRPFNTMWADPSKREEHHRREKSVQEIIQHPILKRFIMPSREELDRAQIPAEEFVNYNKDWYDGSIREMDTQLGRLVEGLEAMGLGESTLIAFTSDHGEEFLEHGRTFHGHTLYGELTNVPLVFWWPGRIERGSRSAEVVESIDIMPTLLDLSGISVPEAAQGASLLPLMGGGGSWTPRPAFSERAKTVHPFGTFDPGVGSYAVTTPDWKLIHHVHRRPGMPEFELFDVKNDPLNLTDLAPANAEVVQELAAEIQRWRDNAEAAKLPSDAEAMEGIDAGELEKLRNLGYIQ